MGVVDWLLTIDSDLWAQVLAIVQWLWCGLCSLQGTFRPWRYNTLNIPWIIIKGAEGATLDRTKLKSWQDQTSQTDESFLEVLDYQNFDGGFNDEVFV